MKSIKIKIKHGERLVIRPELPNSKKYIGKFAGDIEILDQFSGVKIFKRKKFLKKSLQVKRLFC